MVAANFLSGGFLPLTSIPLEKSSQEFWKEKLSVLVRETHRCITDSYGMTLAFKMELNLNTSKQTNQLGVEFLSNLEHP